MTKLLYASLIMSLSFITIGCCNPGYEPNPPYGKPDDTSRYSGSDGYKSIDFTYYCHNGQYVSVTYVRKDACSDYKKDSEFTSSGICDSPGFDVESLDNLNATQKLLFLQSQGFKIDTLLLNSVNYNQQIMNP